MVLKIFTKSADEVLAVGARRHFILHEEKCTTSIIGKCSTLDRVSSDSRKPQSISSDNFGKYSNLLCISSLDDDSPVNKCYQCILCTPMFFQNKKKRLWRARVMQSANNNNHGPPYQNRCAREYADCFGRNSDSLHQHSCSRVDSILCPTLYSGCTEISGACFYSSGKAIPDYAISDQTLLSEDASIKTLESTATTTISSNIFRNCCTGICSSSLRNGGSSSNSSTSSQNSITSTTNEQKEIFRALVAKLKECQLTTLCHAIENGPTVDDQQPDCVLLPRENILGEEPNVIACRIWRWPDLKSPLELKSIPSCLSEKDPVYVCCNPSHWSRLCMPDLPPPPYNQLALDRHEIKAQPLSDSLGESGCGVPESLTTDGEEVSTSSWCQLAYWELSQRVGSRFPVENSSVNVFSDQPRGDGMCLKTLAEQRQSETPESVLKARQKIGLGVTLSQESDGVWLYNRSTVPVFVHSPTLNDIDCWSHVSKVLPGHCLRAFDYKIKLQTVSWPPQICGSQTGPVDKFSMRISFAKGWGPNYSRQDVTACPCWLEVLFPRR